MGGGDGCESGEEGVQGETKEEGVGVREREPSTAAHVFAVRLVGENPE